jgi:hypothetical protein
MKIKKYRHRESFSHYLEPPELRGAGFSFECDKDGKVDVDKLPKAARENYDKCLANDHGHPISKGKVEEFEHSYMNPAVGECDCGEEVVLSGFTNTCDRCGADY